MTAVLESAVYEKGLDQPLDDGDAAVVEARKLGVKTIDDILAYAMEHGQPAAATAAARLLGQVGKAEDILYMGATPDPLARALRQPDRRLRMAALESVVQLRPTRPYAGSSYVPAACISLRPRAACVAALSAGPNLAETRQMAGMLSTAGFRADTAIVGREVLTLAAHSPDMNWP